MKINIKRNHKDAVIPEFAHSTDTGFDLFTCEDLELLPYQKGIAKTGLMFELPKGYGFQVRNKSGMTVKGVPCTVVTQGLDRITLEPKISYHQERIDITVYLGTIDEGYTGEVGIMVKNETDKKIIIPKHTKLAQGVLEKVYQCEFIEVEEVKETDRGDKGYGSSGTSK